MAVSSTPRIKTPGPTMEDVLPGNERNLLVLVGALILAAVVAVAGITVLTKPETPPLRPYFPLADISEVAQPILDVDRDILYVPEGDGVRAFPSPGDSIDFCTRSGNIESVDGEVWNRSGQPLNASGPLDEYRVIVFDGTIYVDTSGTQPAEGAAGGGGSAQAQCTGDQG